MKDDPWCLIIWVPILLGGTLAVLGLVFYAPAWVTTTLGVLGLVILGMAFPIIVNQLAQKIDDD